MNELIHCLNPIFDGQPYAVLALDSEYNIVYSNKASSKLFHIAPEGKESKCYRDLHGLDSPPGHCYCGRGSSVIKVSRVFEPSINMTLSSIRIPIDSGANADGSLLIYIQEGHARHSTQSAEPLVLDDTADLFALKGDLFTNLTSKEREVLSWIKKGKPSAQISHIMGISPNTVNFHIKNVFNKLGADNRAQAVALAYEKELQQRDIAIREIHHRVMNNFIMLNSILNLKSRGIADKEVAAVLRNISLQVKGLASFHSAMIPTGNSACVSASLFIGKALEDFSKSIETSCRHIAIEHEIEDIPIHTDTAITCMQIISELVCNSLKHAFDEGEKGRIKVRFSRLEGLSGGKESRINLEVEDNGRGLPESFDIVSGRSNGMRIVSALASQLGGEIKTCPVRNSCISMSFKDNDQCSN